MPDPQLTLDVLFDDDAHGAVPTQLAWRPTARRASDQLAGLWNEGGGDAWWLFDAAGARTLLARPEDFGAAAAGDVQGIRWSAGGRHLLVMLEGRFLLFDPQERCPVVLRGSEAEVRGEDPKLSPDGRRLAFVRDHDLWALDLERREERRLTDDGVPGTVFNGATDWVYWEEIWGRDASGHWWNRDGTRLAYYRLDDSEVPVYPLVDTRPLHPRLERQRYPKAGDPLPRAEVRVADVESGRRVRLSTHDDARSEVYLARVHWHPDGEHLAVERLSRGQTRLDLLLCSSGDGSCRVLATQEQPTWVNLGDEFVFLEGGRFLWSGEESGWRQLYLYEADGGGRRQVTPDGWAVASLDAVNVAEGSFVFTAHAVGALGAAERHVFRGEVDGSVRRLTETAGWHAATLSPGGSWVDERSDAATPPRQTIRHLERRLEVALPHREPAYDVARLPRWERRTIPGPGGVELPAQLLKPAGFDPGRAYPMLMYCYGCPSSQVVEDRWVTGRPRFLWHRMMAERGYAVFAVDNEASAHFGKRGEDRAHRRFGELELAAQLAGVDYLRTLPWVDASRIGLWGWSGGGSHTLYSLFRRPGVWKAGVAGAPVTDWRYYDAIWTERYLGHPRDNPEGYQTSAPLAHAARLRDPLLVVHGTGDDNVHPQNAYNLIDAFVEAGVSFELALYPNAGHGIQSFTKAGQRHVFARMTEFFDRHLQPGSINTDRRRGSAPPADRS